MSSKIFRLFMLLLAFFGSTILKVTGQTTELPPFIKPAYNYVEFGDSAEFLKVKRGLEQAKTDGFVIAHFGDSHVQPDFSTTEMRRILQEIGGDGGRGMIYPYSIAKSYSHSDYKSSYTGTWESANSMHTMPKIPLGVSGFVSKTQDSAASFTIAITKPLPIGPKTIKLICDNPNNAYTIKLSLNNKFLRGVASGSNVISFQSPVSFDTLSVEISKVKTTDEPFQLYGLVLESGTPGVLCHNLGVGGARFDAILQQKLFKSQIGILNPDLFILDWGTNDIIAGNAIPVGLRENIIATIDLIREQFPNAAIMLTSVQDMNRRGRNITSAKTFSIFIREIALEKNCLFYDWFRVSGGARKMKKWVAEQYAGKDNIHLTVKGYRLKGQLMGQAILNSLDSAATNQNLDSLLIANETIQDSAMEVEKEKTTTSNKGSKYYVVKKDETLSGIAARNKTTVAAIKKANGLKNDRINAGQKLIIRKP
ncbi:MAG: LysM peptidoglycan-binding domain-containing protein [Bacteroidota bacterium]